MQLKALLLDLDGTLVDTAPDMVGALNKVLSRHGEPPADYEVAGKMVSNGARALIEHGFGDALGDSVRETLIEEFLVTYAQHVCDDSALYEGMSDVLDLCEAENIRWGVVTNKPLALARSVLDGLNLLQRSSILLGGDSLPVKKPDPAPLLHCCMVLSLAGSECLYVGDHERDIMAGNAAGMDTAAALWGYIDEHEQIDQWNAKYLTTQPQGLYKLIAERLA